MKKNIKTNRSYLFFKKKYFIIRNSSIQEQGHQNSSRVYNTFKRILQHYDFKLFSKNSKVLDIGCGGGSLIDIMKKDKIDAKGVDFKDIDLEFQKINEKNNSMDYIICYSLIEHIRNSFHLFSNIKRILKKNGVLIIITPNFKYCYKEFYDDCTHVTPYTQSGLKHCLKIYNFKKIHIVPWLVNKSTFWWDVPGKFFFARYFFLFQNDVKFYFPQLFKGKSNTLICICKK